MIGWIIVFVIVIIAACAILYYKSDRGRRRRANRYIEKSAGGFDDGAQRALQELMAMDQPTVADRLARTSIVRYNMFEGAIPAAAARNIVAVDYVEVLNAIHEVPEPQFHLGRMGQFRDQVRGGAADIPNIADFLETFDRVEPAVAAATISERRERAAETADNKADAAAAYFEDAVEWTDDPQNVHDSAMNRDLNDTLQRLKNEPVFSASSPAKCISEARAEINSMGDKNAADNAKRVLTRIESGSRISTFGGAAEDEIFALVWNRCRHPANAAAAADMRESILDALADSVEHGSVVCANGRSARLLNSLTLLDFDSQVGRAMTSTAYKNQIYEETQQILDREIEKARASDDADWRLIGESMAGDAEVDDTPYFADLQNKFVNIVKKGIDANLENYREKLPQATIERLREECYAGIDV